MNAPISLQDCTLGDIAAALPGASTVFRRFHLDYCCGGDVTLRHAADRKGVSSAAVEQALVQRDPAQGAPAPAETGALIDHILSRYHDRHREVLPDLILLARRVETVHRDDPAAPHGLSALLEDMADKLERHMQKEEAILFPALRRAATRIEAPIAQMRHDHLDQRIFIDQIERLTNHFRPPADACRSWRALYADASALVDDVMEHVSLENNTLFPRFD